MAPILYCLRNVIDVDRVTKDCRRVDIRLLNGCPSEAKVSGIRQSITHVLGKTIDSPLTVRPLPFSSLTSTFFALKPYWERCASSAITTILVRSDELLIDTATIIRLELLNSGEDHTTWTNLKQLLWVLLCSLLASVFVLAVGLMQQRFQRADHPSHYGL